LSRLYSFCDENGRLLVVAPKKLLVTVAAD